MSFKKHIWKGLAVAAAFTLSLGLVQSAFATAAVTTPGHTTVSLATNAATGTGVYTTVNNIVLTAGAVDFTAAGDLTFTAPAGWSFDTGGADPTRATTGTIVIAAVPTVRTATTITFNVTTDAAAADTVTIAGIRIRPNTANSVSGSITSAQAIPTSLNVASIIPSDHTSSNVAGSKVVLSVTIGDPANIRSDGTTSVTITASVFNDANNNNVLDSGECTAAHQGIIVSWTTSRGTLSSSSSTTTSTSSQTSTSCLATIPLRGNGTTGLANVTAVITQPVAAVATMNLQITAGTITPTDLKFRDANNSAHVAANQDTLYVTTNNVTLVRFRVANSADQGSNGQVIQGTVDKGNIRPWVDNGAGGGTANNNIVDGTEGTAACTDQVTTTFTSQRNTIDGVDVEGVAVFIVCAKAGQAAGPIKVTAKNLTTTMADASTTVTSSGIPNKIETSVSGNTVTVTVKDKDGNNVAENTPVSFQVPAFTGTVSPGCALTSGGKVSGSAAFSGAGGQVLITVFHSSSGAAAGCNGGQVTNGNTVSASATVNVGAASGTPTGPGTGGFTGAAPARGSIGLLVTNQASSAAGLVSALGTAGCTAESIAVLEGGVWKIYINGAPAVVNSAFPGTVAATTAFFVRCAA